MACLQWCPETAIQYGKVTKKRKRYHHPQVQIKDLILREESKMTLLPDNFQRSTLNAQLACSE